MRQLAFSFLLFSQVFCFSQSNITDSLIKIASRVNNDSASKVYAKIANIFTGVNSDSVRKYALVADALASEGSITKGDALIQIGNSYHMENKVDSALLYYQKALVYYQEIKNDKGIGKVYQSFSIVKKTLGDLTGAIEDSKKALEIYTKMNWIVGIVNTYNNIASTYNRLQNHKEAVKYGRLAFSTSKLLNDSLKYFSMMSEYGSKLASFKKLDSAKYYIYFSSRFLERNKMYNLLIPAYSNLAYVMDYTNKNELKLAKEALLKAKTYAFLSGAEDNLRYIYKGLSSVYIRENNPDSAEFYLNKTLNLMDTLNLLNGIQLAKDIETKYETEKKELQIKNQYLQIESGNKENEAKNKLLLIAAAGLLSIAIFAFIAFINYRKTKKANVLINEQKQEVELKNTLITQQKIIVDQKQKEILDSIQYAKHIQKAMLPPTQFVNKHIPQNFIFYKPKDIVAGDFYWAEYVNDVFFIAAADSTGHGVPGAMVSVVCSNALNRSVKEFKISDTGKILDKTRELVLETFAKSGDDVKDGMDISLLALDSKSKKISWSGANNPLWYIQGDTFHEIKGDKQPVGKTDVLKSFTTHEIIYEENTLFYLFTDGYPDQFGGPNGKKYKYNRFAELIISLSSESLGMQAESLDSAFTDWKKNQEQTDDVCIIGLKI